MAGEHIGERRKTVDTTEKPAASKHIQSAEELFGIMSSAGINVGVIHQTKPKPLE